MSNFWARTITGLSMVFVLLAALYFSGWVFAFIFLVITFFGVREFFILIESAGFTPQKWYGIIAGMILYIITVVIGMVPFGSIQATWLGMIPFIVLIPLIFIAFVIEIFRNKPSPLVNVSLTVTGMLYVALPLSLLTWFNRPTATQFAGVPVILVGYFALTWIYDTTAYLYGKQFGKHKFFERISPKKTWEGTIAGALITLIVALLFHYVTGALPLTDWIVLACLVLSFGTLGDLAESLIKRSLNVKDSGTILPGHGGILDRFDTMLLSAPFVFLYFFFRNTI